MTVASTTPLVCAIGGATGRTVTLLTAGVCTLTASQSGSTAYSPATDVSQSFNVSLLDQTITFATIARAWEAANTPFANASSVTGSERSWRINCSSRCASPCERRVSWHNQLFNDL